MLNYIWSGMILISLLTGFITGNIESVTKGAIDGCSQGVELCVSMLGIMCFWTGLSKIAEKSGLIKAFSKLLKPLTRFLFPRLKEGSPAYFAIIMNIVANFFGMGNAATPLGIKAMKELDKINCDTKASYEMCVFTVLNTASIQLIPSTLISLRHTFGSQNPSIIIVPVWIVSICAASMAILSAKFFEKRQKI
ncbi:MAG: nucleoside recognition protein [Ruminococcaceae bacterium]|nr:nucleoside recognition protein [Oscillospiraceae bacterium]